MNRQLKNLLPREPARGQTPLDLGCWKLHANPQCRTAAPVAASIAPHSVREERAAAVEASQKFRSILVPVDGTPFGEHAIPAALGIAERAGAELSLVHVHCPLQPEHRADRLYPDGGLDEWLLRSRRAYLDGLRRRVAQVAAVRVRSVFVEGPEIAESLCSAAASARADLLVMATRGRGPLGRLWFGSVADAMMRRLPVPVLFVRGSDAPADIAGAPAFQHVLIPLDGSKRAEEILPTALALGRMSDALHTLIRFVPLEVDYSLDFAPLMRPHSQSKQEAEASRDILDVKLRLEAESTRIRTRTVVGSRPTADAILQYARTCEADLIALVTRGRGNLSRLLQRSVVERVIRDAAVPVLVHRSAAA